MSKSAASPYVDQFSCPVCLDPLKEPVTIPCGHSYCMSCITDCWGQKEQGPPYRCPQCRESFSQRPLLKKNTLIAEMMETLQKTSLQTAAVECDVCTTEKNRAVKSCLQCLASFCQTHLQLHYQSPAFMKHKLVEASRHIQENFCLSHGKLLEIYCQDDRQCICCLCTDNHKGHSVVSVDSEWTSKKEELKEIKVSCQKLIQERERGQQELSEAVKLLKSSALETMEDIEKVFTELICSLEKKRSEIKEQIRAQEKTEIDRAEELHKHLDQELTELRKRQAEIDKLLITDDQVQCLKSCQSVCVLPTFKDVPSFTQHTHLSFKDFSITAFREVLEDVCLQQTAKISPEVSNVNVTTPPEPKTQNDFLQYFCEIHLDLNTAHRNLKLSENNRKISYCDKDQQYPDQPERFNVFPYILSRESLCGRCYWEVECSGNDCAVAVCYKGIRRKGNGVYLDHRAGTLSFYSVSDTMTLLHRVQTTFTEPLYPAFGSCQSVCVLPTFEEVPSFTQHTHLSFKDISVSAFKEVLEDVCHQQTARISREVSNVHVAQTPEPKTPNTFWQYFCQLQLDPNTAYKKLILSEENRRASHSVEAQQYPDHPERFDWYIYILCREGLYSRCYWEVECSGNDWSVSVCYKGIGRKGKSQDCRLGGNVKSWRLSLDHQNVYFTHDNKRVSIPAVCSSRIGVYLDHRAGTLSFYSVSDTMTLLHRVQTTFTEPLYPAFYSGEGSSVRIIEEQNLKLKI